MLNQNHGFFPNVENKTSYTKLADALCAAASTRSAFQSASPLTAAAPKLPRSIHPNTLAASSESAQIHAVRPTPNRRAADTNSKKPQRASKSVPDVPLFETTVCLGASHRSQNLLSVTYFNEINQPALPRTECVRERVEQHENQTPPAAATGISRPQTSPGPTIPRSQARPGDTRVHEAGSQHRRSA